MARLISFLKNYKLDNVTALQVFQLLRFAVFFLVGILFAKLNVKQEQIGIYETVLVIAGAASFFWVNGLIGALLSLHKNKEQTQNSLFFNAFIVVSAFAICAVLGLWLFKGFLCSYFALPATVYNYCLLYLFFNTPAFLVEYFYLLLGKPRRMVVYGITVFVLQLFLVVGPIVAGYSVIESIIGLCVVALLKYLYLLAILIKHAVAKLDYSFIKEHVVLAYPLILAALVGGASEYTDGIIITHYFDKSSLAIYRYGAKELPLTLLMANALSNAMVPIVASTANLSESIAQIRKQANRFMHFMFPVSIALMLCSGWLYVHFFNKQFIGSAAVFNMYLLLILARCLFPQTVLMGLKQNKLLLGVAIVEIILNVVLSVILCKSLGIIGVALGTVIAATFEKLLLLSICKQKFNVLPNQLVNTRTYFIYSCILIAIYFWSS